MKVSTQTAKDLDLPLSQLVGAKTYDFYVSGRGYDASHAIAEAEKELPTRADDAHILINKQVRTVRTSHPNSDFGDYRVFITGDLYRIAPVEEAKCDS